MALPACLWGSLVAVGGQVGADGSGVLGGEGGGGCLEHVHEPVDFGGDGGVADVAAGGGGGVGAKGVDDGVAGGGEHEDVGIAGGVAAEGGAESSGSGGVVVFGVGGMLAYVEGGDAEGFVHDGGDGGVGEEVVEPVAGTAPGGAEDEQDVFVLGGGGGAGLGEDVVGGGFGVQGGGEDERGGDEGGAEEGGGAHVAVEVSGQEVWLCFIMRERWQLGG